MSELVGNGSKERWYPNSVGGLKRYLSNYEINEYLCADSKYVIANISYNLQYIEYLRKTLNELNLSIVLQVQTIKNFIIISTSIIEAIFYLICCNEGLRKENIWKEHKTTGKSEVNHEGSMLKFETKLYIKNSNPDFEILTFDQMIKKIERKKLLNQKNQFFKDLNHLRKLRNKIHLQETQLIGRTDYNSFWRPEYELSKLNLRNLLLDDLFASEGEDLELFDFLKVNNK